MKIYANREDISSLRRYAGTDLWVEVISKRTHRYLYINISRVSDDGEMLYRSIPSDEIEYSKKKYGYMMFDYAYKRTTTINNNNVDDFVVLKPLDILTTDELLEQISKPEDIEIIKKSIAELNARLNKYDNGIQL